VSKFVSGLRADVKREVKIHPLYSLDVAYKKTLDYEKYLSVVPRRVFLILILVQVVLAPFIGLTLVPNMSTLHHHQSLLLVFLPLAWLRQHMFCLVLVL